MSGWTNNELARVGAAEELQIAPRRPDGSLRKPVPIWVVRVADNLYVRSYRGPRGAWYRAALDSREGRIRAGGVEKEVQFVPQTDPALNARIDAAYHNKYGRYSQYVPPMVTSEARSTTLKLVPA